MDTSGSGLQLRVSRAEHKVTRDTGAAGQACPAALGILGGELSLYGPLGGRSLRGSSGGGRLGLGSCGRLEERRQSTSSARRLPSSARQRTCSARQSTSSAGRSTRHWMSSARRSQVFGLWVAGVGLHLHRVNVRTQVRFCLTRHRMPSARRRRSSARQSTARQSQSTVFRLTRIGTVRLFSQVFGTAVDVWAGRGRSWAGWGRSWAGRGRSWAGRTVTGPGLGPGTPLQLYWNWHATGHGPAPAASLSHADDSLSQGHRSDVIARRWLMRAGSGKKGPGPGPGRARTALVPARVSRAH